MVPRHAWPRAPTASAATDRHRCGRVLPARHSGLQISALKSRPGGDLPKRAWIALNGAKQASCGFHVGFDQRLRITVDATAAVNAARPGIDGSGT